MSKRKLIATVVLTIVLAGSANAAPLSRNDQFSTFDRFVQKITKKLQRVIQSTITVPHG